MGKKNIDYRDAENENKERDKDRRLDFIGYT
jgi:hypothetical protein